MGKGGDQLGLYQVEARKNTFVIMDWDAEEENPTLFGETGSFEFQVNELPEGFNWDYVTKLKHIEYDDGFQTNQIRGSYLEPVTFSGNFYGPWFDGQQMISAKERSDILEAIARGDKNFGSDPTKPKQPLPVKVVFGLGELSGPKGVFIIEEYKRTIKNSHDVDYTIKLMPHDPQDRVAPGSATNMQAAPPPTPAAITASTTKVNAKVGNMKTTTPAAASTKGGLLTDTAQIPHVGGLNAAKAN